MRELRLIGSQFGYINKSFWRNPTRAFFTFAFPLMFLVIFTSLLGNGTVHVGHRLVHQSSYYVAAMASYGMITSCFNNMAMTVAVQRDSLVLKRLNGSPLPTRVFLAAQFLHALFVAAITIVVMAAFGAAFYRVQVPNGMPLVRFVVMLVVGSVSFCALGMALTRLIPNADAAPVVVNAVSLPLLFLSGIFIVFDNTTPSWILTVARIFPIRHFATAMEAGFLGAPFHWSDVVVVGAWGAAGAVLAARYFSFEPLR